MILGGCFVMADWLAGGCAAKPSHNHQQPPAQHDDRDGCDQPPDELDDERDDQQGEQELPKVWMAHGQSYRPIPAAPTSQAEPGSGPLSGPRSSLTALTTHTLGPGQPGQSRRMGGWATHAGND